MTEIFQLENYFFLKQTLQSFSSGIQTYRIVPWNSKRILISRTSYSLPYFRPLVECICEDHESKNLTETSIFEINSGRKTYYDCGLLRLSYPPLVFLHVRINRPSLFFLYQLYLSFGEMFKEERQSFRIIMYQFTQIKLFLNDTRNILIKLNIFSAYHRPQI